MSIHAKNKCAKISNYLFLKEKSAKYSPCKITNSVNNEMALAYVIDLIHHYTGVKYA